MTSETRTDERTIATRITSATDEVTDATEEALSDVLGRVFPEATHGDESPDMAFGLRLAISKAVREYVEAWVAYNVAPTLTWRNDHGDDVVCSCGNEVNLDGFYACDGYGIVFPDGGTPLGYAGVSLVACGRCQAVYHQPDGLRAGSIIIGERI